MVYNESQTLKDSWFVPVFFGIQLLATAVALVYGVVDVEGFTSTGLLGLVLFISFLIGWLMVSMKLQIRLNATGLSYKSPPFINSWRKHKWEEVKHIQQIKRRSILSGGGLGIRYDLKGEWKYLFSTCHVVRVSLKDSSFVWSTRNPKKILEAWEEWGSER
ncbi:hypothetical protein [Cyclobacterium marinum]|uniref:Bacterial Pleckstrin homology domain-containing protein n=1 Tax=Cyclobacterium marinum (strain ATCC 25205 / DSM 745 / LMG 13164 / NCIMB 1802) TaxID=880070 RepID=G0J225_CYCMS|nr:hypothetical protein [Cyclobacterium marinum]AEL24534.1 hypothetical protein Cycma_0760 [Cyclobacterium marinum DSM 745]MBR9777280.1 hypothetical protein [Cytophagales bacterium]|tara:strand:- start:33607 stop:34089 length:483 start_codon:yes stop_codon:yes gene_type:complete